MPGPITLVRGRNPTMTPFRHERLDLLARSCGLCQMGAKWVPQMGATQADKIPLRWRPTSALLAETIPPNQPEGEPDRPETLP